MYCIPGEHAFSLLLDLFQPYYVNALDLIGELLQLPVEHLHEGMCGLRQGTHGCVPRKKGGGKD